MATGPALQRTGTQMLAAARYWAQDQDTNNPAVSAGDGLERLNDRLIWWQHNFENRMKTVASATTGLAFAAGEMTKTVTNDVGIMQIASLHPASATSVAYPLSQPVPRVAVEKLFGLYYGAGNQYGGTAGQGGTEWECWAAELDQTSQDDWRVYVYPALGIALNATVRSTIANILSAITETPDISPYGARIVERLLGYDMAGIQKQNDPAYLAWILSGVPANVQAAMFGDAKNAGAQQSEIRDFGYASS
jgi:hypothetical protein